MGTQESSSSTVPCAYDVFLSFRGKDTRKGFTDHLYTALLGAGFRTFRDVDEIQSGENIESELKRAIRQSRISIIIFSKTYPVSSRCLDELLEILHCHKTFGLHLLPVFYDVDPLQVKWQSGDFEEAFARHEESSNQETDKERKQELMERVKKWREALKDVTDLGGMVLERETDGYEAKFIEKIVKVIGGKLKCKVLNVASFLIGIDFRAKNINSWLQDKSTKVCVIAICGMAGVGKSTIAKFVYNIHHGRFDSSSFLANIRKRSEAPNGLVSVQKQLLSDIGSDESISCHDEGIIKIQRAICCRRILLVLDDVDQDDQLNAIYGMQNWFTPGSKIILTTRNEHLLKPHEACKVEKVELFNTEESLELFSWHAFGQDHPIEDYLELSKLVSHYCGGLPLALRVLGSSLSGQSVEYWDSALKKLKVIPDNKILEKLKISLDSLEDDHDKDLFVDIACFFLGRDIDLTIKVLDKCDFYTVVGIQNLVDRSLLEIDTRNKLSMHELLRDMGREIARLESPSEPGRRSRLWHHKDSFKVMKDKIGTNAVKGLLLDMYMFKKDKSSNASFDASNSKKRHYHELLEKSDSVKRRCLGLFNLHKIETISRNSRAELFEADAFARMNKLRLLHLNYIELSGSFRGFPKTIVWLCWSRFPLESIPGDFHLESLVVLEMHCSNLKQLWKGVKFAHQLKILDLSYSNGLIKTPDFSGCPNLETLILEACPSLVEIHKSIGKLEGLVLLNLRNCQNLRELPKCISMLRYLGTLIISGCSSLELSSEMMKINSLRSIYADRISMNVEVIQPWYAIFSSWLSRVERRKGLLQSLSLPSRLMYLSFVGCKLFDDAFPVDLSSLSQLQHLDLSETWICGLPEGLRGVTRLETLMLNSCRRLKTLVQLPLVERLCVMCCPSLEKISYQPPSSSTSDLQVHSCPTLKKAIMVNCCFCDNLVEVEGWFKLEPVEILDIDFLKSSGFFNIESIRNKKIDYYNRFSSTQSKKLPLQRLHESGVNSYFLPESEVPYGFRIKSTRSPVSFFVVPSVDQVRIRGLIVCCVYKYLVNPHSSPLDHPFRSSETFLFISFIENRTKHVKWTHAPIFVGIPRVNEDMIWLSHWNFGTLLANGDMLEVTVDTSPFELKEVAVQPIYQRQGEMDFQPNPEAITKESSLYRQVVPGELSTEDGETLIHKRSVFSFRSVDLETC